MLGVEGASRTLFGDELSEVVGESVDTCERMLENSCGPLRLISVGC